MKIEKNTKYLLIGLGILLAWSFFTQPTATVESFSTFGDYSFSTTLIGIPIIFLFLLPIYGIYVSIKKNYNPFKMKGAWVGAFIGLIIGYIYPFGILVLPLINLCQGEFCTAGGSNITNIFIAVFVVGILGFLAGWGLNSIWRKYK